MQPRDRLSPAACATAPFTSFLKIAAPFALGGPACRCEKPAQSAAAPKTRTPGSAAVVEGYLVAVGVRERESAAERPVDWR
jgi:hypothetical protein